MSNRTLPHLDRVGLSCCLLRDVRGALQATLLGLLPRRPPGAGEGPLPEHLDLAKDHPDQRAVQAVESCLTIRRYRRT